MSEPLVRFLKMVKTDKKIISPRAEEETNTYELKADNKICRINGLYGRGMIMQLKFLELFPIDFLKNVFLRCSFFL